MRDLGSRAVTRVGSSPFRRTKQFVMEVAVDMTIEEKAQEFQVGLHIRRIRKSENIHERDYESGVILKIDKANRQFYYLVEFDRGAKAWISKDVCLATYTRYTPTLKSSHG